MNDYLASFFETALEYTKKNCLEEYTLVDERHFEDIEDPLDLFYQYIYVVFNSGMKHSIAEKMLNKYLEKRDLNTISHLGKRKAVFTATQDYPIWYAKLKVAPDKIAYLSTLPYLGRITKYHLARNLGIDCCKPDRHLLRLAFSNAYSCPDARVKCRNLIEKMSSCRCQHECVNRMCQELADKFNLRIGTVDFVLWAYIVRRGIKELACEEK